MKPALTFTPPRRTNALPQGVFSDTQEATMLCQHTVLSWQNACETIVGLSLTDAVQHVL